MKDRAVLIALGVAVVLSVSANAFQCARLRVLEDARPRDPNARGVAIAAADVAFKEYARGRPVAALPVEAYAKSAAYVAGDRGWLVTYVYQYDDHSYKYLFYVDAERSATFVRADESHGY